MAKKLKDDAVKITDQNPASNINFPELKKLADALVKQREVIAGENQEAGSIVKKAENDYGANAAAFKLLVKLTKMSEEGRGDFLRTLVPGLSAFGLTPRADLVDMMETA